MTYNSARNNQMIWNQDKLKNPTFQISRVKMKKISHHIYTLRPSFDVFDIMFILYKIYRYLEFEEVEISRFKNFRVINVIRVI